MLTGDDYVESSKDRIRDFSAFYPDGTGLRFIVRERKYRVLQSFGTEGSNNYTEISFHGINEMV